MKKIFQLLSVALLATAVVSCSREEVLAPTDELSVTSNIQATVGDFEFEDGTRAVLTDDFSSVAAWSDNDQIRLVYSNSINDPSSNDNYVANAIYTLLEGGQATGIFKNSGFKLLPNSIYSVWYPIADWNQSGNGLEFKLWNQIQQGNGTTDHIGKNCIMRAIARTNAAGEFTNPVQFEQECALFKLDISADAGTYTHAVIYNLSHPMSFYVNLRVAEDRMHLLVGEGYITMPVTMQLGENEQGISLEQGETLTLYVLMPPTHTYSDAKYELVLYNADQETQAYPFTKVASVIGQPAIQRGHGYSFQLKPAVD